MHTEQLDATQPEQRHITHTVYEPETFTPLVQLGATASAQAKPQALALMAGDEGDDSPTARMLDALPGDMQHALEQSLRHAMHEGIPAPMQALMGEDQSQNTVQRLTGLREQLEKQEQNQQTEITVRHYHCDHLGTPIALTDEQQNIVWAARLDPWGNIEQEFNPHDIEQSIRLPGQHHDKETGLYYNRHRYYDPSIGAYVNQDPIGFDGGANGYVYPKDPLAWIDPWGLKPKNNHPMSGEMSRRKGDAYEEAIRKTPQTHRPENGYPNDASSMSDKPPGYTKDQLKMLNRACKTWSCSDGLTCKVTKATDYIPPASTSPPQSGCSCIELGGPLETPSAPTADSDDLVEILQKIIRSRTRGGRTGR